jgi:hypothetical protein
VKWHARARQMIYDHWRMKNAGRASAEYRMGDPAKDTARRSPDLIFVLTPTALILFSLLCADTKTDTKRVKKSIGKLVRLSLITEGKRVNLNRKRGEKCPSPATGSIPKCWNTVV